jgi:anti-sigma B factor antagonist
MPVRIREIKDVNILDIDGKVDINSSDIVEAVGWLVNTGKTRIIFNLENVDMVDYNGLSIFAISYKSITNHKGSLRFLNVPLSVIELFKVVKLENIFEVYADEESAVESFYDKSVSALNLRRKFARLDIHLKVKYKLSGNQKNPETFEGQVLNISAAGLYIFTHSTFPINAILDMTFTIPKASDALEAAGRVSWLSDKDIQPHYYPGMGVSFIHLNGEKEQSIIDFIEKNITHRSDTI